MITFIEHYFTHYDERGSIEGLINFGQWQEINLITSISGIKRGGHYHKQTIEAFIILEGKIKIYLNTVKDKKIVENSLQTSQVKKGDVFFIDKNTYHLFEIVEEAKWLNLLSQKHSSDNPDIHTPQQ